MTVRRTVAALPLILGSLALAAPDARAVEFTEYETGGRPAGIARGADGNMWVTDAAGAGRVLRVSPAGAVTGFASGLTPNAAPAGIAQGPDGNVWFTESARAAVGRVTPDGAITEFTAGISPGSEPWDIVAGPDGNLWFTERSGKIGRITPSGEVTEFSAGMPAGARPNGITVGADGNLWFTDASASAAVGSITTGGVITVFDAAIPAGSAPYDIAAGSDGNLWFTLSASNQVGRMTPGGEVSLFGGLRPHGAPMGITLGPDGRVWLAQRDGGRVTAVNTAGQVEELPSQLTHGEEPTEVASGPGGTVWVTEAGRGGAVGVFRGAGPDTPVGLPGTTPGLPGGAPITAPTASVESVSAGGQTAASVTEALEAMVGEAGAEGQDWSLPEQGKDFLVAPITGEIYVRQPKGKKSPPLPRKLRNIRNGSRVDTSRGVIALVSALPKKRYQVALFKDGRFDVSQKRKGGGMVDLTLRGKTGCGGEGEADDMDRAFASISAKRKLKKNGAGRRLWAADKRGKFRTHGRDSVATVRGTEWITEDTCEGTRTTVVKGAVEVRDNHTGRRKLVKAGQSHLVRSR